jgi:hypothetical protein
MELGERTKVLLLSITFTIDAYDLHNCSRGPVLPHLHRIQTIVTFLQHDDCVEFGKVWCHTRPKRSTDSSMLKEPLLLPVKISKIKTPKLNTSDFKE